MRIIVTGGAGFIGSRFVRTLLAQKTTRIINVDVLNYAGSKKRIAEYAHHPRHLFIAGDLRDPSLYETLASYLPADAIVHFAAQTHVDRSLRDATPFFTTNIEGTYRLLKFARKHSIRRFLHISTDEVYGPQADGETVDEKAPLQPTNPYAISKAAADSLVLSAYRTHRLPVLITRSCNIYGFGQHPEKFIPRMIRCACENRPLPLYGDGRQVRDWLHADDFCRALTLILHEGKPGHIYHAAGRNRRCNREVAERILDVFQLSHDRIRHVRDRPGHDRRYALDDRKLREMGWKPEISFDKGLLETIQSYRKQWNCDGRRTR